MAFFAFVFSFASLIGFQGADAEETGAIAKHTEKEISVTDYTVQVTSLGPYLGLN